MSASLDEVKSRIKSRVPLEKLIGESCELTRKGSNFVGCCPFHAEKSPSFYIYPDNHYYCFGCKESGDAISFVRRTRELNYVDTLRFLASKYGIDAPELDETDITKQRRGEISSLSQVTVAAQDFFKQELKSERGRAARDYLIDRGFTSESVEKFGFGLTPDLGYGLFKHLKSLGFRGDDILKAGLGVISTNTGKFYDFFRERIMIPIRDPQGRIIAFGGRATGDDPAKYKNSGATPLFDKSSVLFGLDIAKEAIRSKGRAIIVEGYMDTLCLWQGGFPETVASMGTSLTLRQLKLLVQQAKTKEAVILFDGDFAGQKATLGLIEVALEVPELRIKAAKLPQSDDPDTFLRSNGPEALRQLISGASDLIDMAITWRLAGIGQAAFPSLVREEFIPWLAKIHDQVKLGFLINKVATLTGIKIDFIQRELRSLHVAPVRHLPQAVRKPMRRLSMVEKGFLGNLYFAQPGELDLSKANNFMALDVNLESLWELFGKRCLEILANGICPKESESFLSVFSHEDLPDLAQITEADPKSFHSDARSVVFNGLLNEQKRIQIQDSIKQLKQQVIWAESHEPADVPKYLAEVSSLTKELSKIG